MFSGNRGLRNYGFGDAAAGAYPMVGGVPPAGVFGGSPTMKPRDVSFDTSSKEPHLIRARVFVGNMNTSLITRDDIIRLFSSYGNLLGVTVFKGYAFIQYGSATEADMAVNALNGYSWNGSVLDVKLAIAGMKTHNVSSTVSPSNGVKRMAENWSSNSANAKKERLEESVKVTAQNNRNRQSAATDETDVTNFYQTGMPDTLICGNCRFVTSDFEQFREHRKNNCITTKTEPSTEWQCSMCDESHSSAGALIEHAVERHNIRLLKESTE